MEEIKAVKIDGARTGNFIQANLILDQLALELNDGILALLGLDFFEGLALECSDVVFFETLAIILKNTTLSFQSSFYKTKNIQKNQIPTEFKNLKENYIQNSNLIFEKERQLSDIISLEFKEELTLIKNFERLNDERITPYFLRLAKTSSNSDSLESIRKEEWLALNRLKIFLGIVQTIRKCLTQRSQMQKKICLTVHWVLRN